MPSDENDLKSPDHHVPPDLPEIKIKEEPKDEEDVSLSTANACCVRIKNEVKEEDLQEPGIGGVHLDINIYENLPKSEELKNEGDNEDPLKVDRAREKLEPPANNNARITSTRTQFKPFACYLCVYTCVTEDELRAHSLLSHENYQDILQCPHCPCRFRFVARFQFHLKSTHLNPTHKCISCDFATSSQREFVRHRSRSQGCRPVPCPDCEKRFNVMHSLAWHWGKVHRYSRSKSWSKRVKFVCPLGCKISYSDRGSFYEHVEDVHLFRSPEVVESCFACDFKGRNNLELLAHYRKTRHNRINQCPVCALRILDMVEFAEHFRECAEIRRAQAASLFGPDSIMELAEVMEYENEDNDGEIDESVQDPNAVDWMGGDGGHDNEVIGEAATHENVSDLLQIKTEPATDDL